MLGIYAKSFVNVSKYDGQRMFDLFESHITAPENTVRWSWKQGKVAMWDNRATIHYAVNDCGEQFVARQSKARCPLASTAVAVCACQGNQVAARECRIARSQI